MKTIIGLLHTDEDVQNSVNQLQKAGIADDKISILTSDRAVQELLDSHQNRVVMRYTTWGAFWGIIVFGLYGLTLGVYAWTSVFRHTLPSFWGSASIMVTVSGAMFGTFAGWLLGAEKFDRGNRPYIWNVRRGSKLIVVQVDNELEPKIMGILAQEYGVAIKTL